MGPAVGRVTGGGSEANTVSEQLAAKTQNPEQEAKLAIDQNSGPKPQSGAADQAAHHNQPPGRLYVSTRRLAELEAERDAHSHGHHQGEKGAQGRQHADT